MSYLNPLRLHFSGRFQANVSTVNNDPGHFDNATFDPSYQQMQTAAAANGWFNPEGDASWRLLGCAITAAWTPDGAVAASDPVLACQVADANSRVSAKLADLDSEQQMVSEIWGLQVRIADAAGNTLLLGDYTPAAFMDIWNRATGGNSGGDNAAGAMYQSVLTNLQWGDIAGSPFLLALRGAAGSGKLSIKFNVDGINLNFGDPEFMCGRLVGTIGPAAAGEPDHLLLGRQFMAVSTQPPSGFFAPQGGINFFAAQVDTSAGCIFLDLGNALSTPTPGGPMSDLGRLTLGVATADGKTPGLGSIEPHGPAGYTDPAWYGRTAGVVVINLTAEQLKAVEEQALVLSGDLAPADAFIMESPLGAFVRADRYVYRLSPGDTVRVPVYATRWGRPFAGADLTFVADAGGLQPSNSINAQDVPNVAVPLSAMPFERSACTDRNGVAWLALAPTDPGTPRYFNGGQDYGIDGQVYGIRVRFTDQRFAYNENQWNFISILLWSDFAPPAPVTWDALQPIFQQYANLYPVMKRFLDLGNFQDVVANAALLKLAFGLDPSNPNAMPVTRDLSPAKRNAILSWLDNPLSGNGAAPARRLRANTAPSPEADAMKARGGKAYAASRRLCLR
ncbi:hypothetical protein [Massilia aquatica]|uniref:Uncharacterized protein n=1 Tax=Massilia aquatica TaxID=2609000 RepID=A0ABX0MDJ2_9BURK|nr:hypothetical protein [Massilia aquatica]NHZ41629.1 hypothetical protein [Massilia aquatica]